MSIFFSMSDRQSVRSRSLTHRINSYACPLTDYEAQPTSVRSIVIVKYSADTYQVYQQPREIFDTWIQLERLTSFPNIMEKSCSSRYKRYSNDIRTRFSPTLSHEEIRAFLRGGRSHSTIINFIMGFIITCRTVKHFITVVKGKSKF